ncbi:hypothetical protein DW026_11835 [Segatella copri]|uniref:Uncharacterized protein n=1 Tax=Segatella copri TaxID=165179 RepID=A0AA92V930_9BACT|nr:hypothetical protein DW026_11835 [Segatella copri]
MWFRHGLKAQKLLAQGNTLGISAISLAPCKGKSLLRKDIKNENKRRQETSTTMAAMWISM